PRSGRFLQEHLCPGEYSLWAEQGGGVVMTEPRNVTLLPDSVFDAGTLWVEALGSVEIELTGDLPAEREQLVARLDRPHSLPVVLEGDGAVFRATGVAAGRWSLAAWAPGFFVHPCEIDVPPGALVRAVCRCEGARPVTVNVRFGPLVDAERDFTLVVQGAG